MEKKLFEIYSNIALRKRLSDTIFLSLKTAIIEGVFNPGSKIDEDSIMQTLNASRSTVREAIMLLENDEYIRFEKGKGYIVNSLSLEEVIKYYEFLTLLGICALRNINPDVHSNKVIIQESLKSDSETTNFGKDRKFHLTIAHLSKNDWIIKGTSDMYDRLFWAKNTIPLIDMDDSIIIEHTVIAEQMEDSNIHDKQELMKNHFIKHLAELMR